MKHSLQMKKFIIFTISLFTLQAECQVIPVSRQVDWSLALHSYDFKVPVNEVNVMDFGATGNGTTNDQSAVYYAIASLNGHLGYIYFPPGNYLMTSPISLPDSAILKGASSSFSVLKFNFSTNSLDCITMVGGTASLLIQLDAGYVKDNSWIRTDSAFLFNAGDYAEILEENGT